MSSGLLTDTVRGQNKNWDSVVDVILTAAIQQSHNWGGPAVTMEFLMKAKERDKNPKFRIQSVYSDAIHTHYTRIAPSAQGYVGRNFVHPIVAAAANGLLSSVGFGVNLLRVGMGVTKHAKILHCHDFPSAYLCSVFFPRKPMLLTLHYKGGWLTEAKSNYPRLEGTFAERILSSIERACVQKARIVCFTSKGARSLFENLHPNMLDQREVRIINPGIDMVDLDHFNQDHNIRMKFGIREHLVLFVGGLVQEKGVDILIKAISLLPTDFKASTTCIIVGKGPEAGSLKRLIESRDLGDSVILGGFLKSEEVLSLMKIANVFVTPSRISVFDQAILEAGGLSRAIITTPVGGNTEILDGESAVFVPPNDEQALSQAIQRVLSDPEIQRRLGGNARSRISSSFSIDATLSSYIRVYEEIALHQQELA